MILTFMKQDAVDFMKHNMERLYTHYFQDETNEWMAKEYGNDPFSDFMEVPDFELADVDSLSIGEANFENCKILYNNLRMLSESQCSDERLWAGLCNGTFYDYMRRRYKYPQKQLKKKNTDVSGIISRFFFSGGTRAGLFRNGLAKCWWVGRATFEKSNPNHFERLDIIGANDITTKISDIFYSNTFSSNPVILAGICDALKYFNERGQTLDVKKHIRASMKYLNALGGVTLLDMLTCEEISKIMISRIISILNGQSGDIDIDNADEEDQLLEEILEDDMDVENNLEDEEDKEKGEIILEPLAKDRNKEELSISTGNSSPFNWFDEVNIEEEMPKPDYITYGCWVDVLNERDNKVITYHIPLKDDKSRKRLPIETKVMGQNIGYRMYMSGKYYQILDFGRDEVNKSKK